MTSRTRLHVLACALALGAGCGNYSNEDLEFMNALPESDQLSASIPPRSSAVTAADEAELARTTHNVTMTFNGIVEQFMALVDGIRSSSPTTRTPDSRTWGPFDAKDHPGWQVRMIITRSATDPALFLYEIDFHLAGGADTDWPAILSGQFQVDGTARRGTGSFDVTTAALLAEGLDPGFGKLDHMHVNYSTRAFPVTVAMHVWNLPDPTMPNAVAEAMYQYEAAADGQGQMTFDLFGNLVPGPLDEQVTVTSQWLGTGEGRATLSVVSGDGAGLMQVECWNSRFIPVFNDKPWSSAEDLGDAAACVQIALLQ
jgi:hypothetical protein